MTTPAKSENVCSGCRSRKRKCDGRRPVCDPCQKRGAACMYPGHRQPISADFNQNGWFPDLQLIDGTQPMNWASGSLADILGFESNSTLADAFTAPAQIGQDSGLQSIEQLQTPIPAPVSHSEKMPGSQSPETTQLPTPESSSPYSTSSGLPPPDRVRDLIDIFFDKFYRYVPVIHKPTFMSRFKNNGPEGILPALLFSIMAVAARSHPDREIQRSQTAWFAEAKLLLSKSIHSRLDGIQTLQGCVLALFHATVSLDFSASWIVLGEAWRKAVAIGSSSIDGPTTFSMLALTSKPIDSWVEKEESRRICWMLFIMDRGMCFPIGLMHAIDDRQLHINFPMSEEEFQAEEEPSSQHSILYTRNMDILIAAMQEQHRQGCTNMLQFIILAYVLLSKSNEQIHSLETDDKEYSSTLETTVAYLVRIRLIIPRSATDFAAADYEDFPYIVWLNAILTVNAIVLHHRALPKNESSEESSEMAANWPHCVAAARSTVAIIRDAARTSVDFILNAHIASPLFMCTRILAIEHFCPTHSRNIWSSATGNTQPVKKSSAVHDDLEVLIFTFRRMREAVGGIGGKFCRGINFHITKGEPGARACKVAGARYMLKVCEKWTDAAYDADVTVPP